MIRDFAHYVWPRVVALIRVEMLHDNHARALTRGYFEDVEIAPARYPGMLPRAFTGDVISPQTVLRGVDPVLAAQAAAQRQLQAGGL